DVGDGDADLVVAGDDVDRRAADGIGGAAAVEVHASTGVAEVGGAVDVGADAVAQHHVARGARIGDLHAVERLAGDDRGGTAGRAADRVVLGAVTEVYAVAGVAKDGRAVDVGADEVAQHHVAAGGSTDDLHAVVVVAGDEVGGTGRRAADRVGRGTE